MTDQVRIQKLEQRVQELEETVATIKEETISEVKSWWQSELQGAMCPPSR